MHTITLKAGREKSLLNGHPWVFSGAISQVDRKLKNGDRCLINSSRGEPLAIGFYNAKSQISTRVLSFHPDDEITQNWLKEKIQKAYFFRKTHVLRDNITTGARIVASEADGLPGLTVDFYSNILVMQVTALGMDMLKGQVVQALMEIFPHSSIYERSDDSVRKLEGLEESVGFLVKSSSQNFAGEVEFLENGHAFFATYETGHKTGWYLDQRDAREYVGQTCSNEKVLNCFSYTCGFARYALAGHAAHVTNVDSSDPALSAGKRHCKDFSNVDYVCSDVFDFLRKEKGLCKKYDTIILDPPKFVATAAQIQKGARAYQDLTRVAFELLEDGGRILLFSCSGHVSLDLLQKIAFAASVQAKRPARIEHILKQSLDHPIHLSIPESWYLKGLVLRAY